MNALPAGQRGWKWVTSEDISEAVKKASAASFIEMLDRDAYRAHLKRPPVDVTRTPGSGFRVTVRVDPAVWQALQDHAAKAGRAITAYDARLLRHPSVRPSRNRRIDYRVYDSLYWWNGVAL